MQLTVFDLPQAVVSAAFNPVEDAVEAPLVAEDSGEVLASNHSMASQKSSQANGQISTIPASDSQEVIAVTDGLSRPEGEPEDIEKPQSPTASMVAQTVGSSAKGFAEDRENTSVLERHPPPAFRIIGYDPRSRRKAVVIVEPQAVLEVCGGVFSPYLHPDRRRELAKTVCDTLVLVFTSGRPFELVVPWSGATKEITTATVSKEATKISDRSSADRVIKRDGKLFRSVLRVSKYDLLVSVYGPSSEFIAAANARNDNDNPLLRQIIFNFYSPAVSEAAEVAVSEQDQIDRIGKPVLHFTEGTIRSAAIRKLSRFFRAEIIIDVLDEKIRTLEVDLLPPSKDFVSDYQQVSVPPPGEDLRPVGIPDVFYPLDSCGNMLHRRGMSLKCRDKSKPNKEFVVSVYTKTELETPERGLVIKLYDRTICSNAILHVGPSELIRICDHAEEFDLLRDISYAINREEALQLDEVEENFTEFTEKGTLRNNTRQLIARLMNVVLNDLGFMYNALDMVIPYIKSGPKGRFPSGF